jgi:hypothetical protein
MTPEAQRKAILEFCGWKKQDPKLTGGEVWHLQGYGYSLPHDLPDYPRDLNAMHEAESALLPAEAERFSYELGQIVSRTITKHCSMFKQIHATASQRAEALLRTIGKWQTEKEPTK